jgi:hypothetical protein
MTTVTKQRLTLDEYLAYDKWTVIRCCGGRPDLPNSCQSVVLSTTGDSSQW